MANQTITQLPTADALTGTELVPIVQDGGTVKTTVADIAAVPVTNYSFVTATSEGSLSQSRQLSTSGGGLTLTDNGAGSTLVLSLFWSACKPRISRDGYSGQDQRNNAHSALYRGWNGRY